MILQRQDEKEMNQNGAHDDKIFIVFARVPNGRYYPVPIPAKLLRTVSLDEQSVASLPTQHSTRGLFLSFCGFRDGLEVLDGGTKWNGTFRANHLYPSFDRVSSSLNNLIGCSLQQDFRIVDVSHQRDS